MKFSLAVSEPWQKSKHFLCCFRSCVAWRSTEPLELSRTEIAVGWKAWILERGMAKPSGTFGGWPGGYWTPWDSSWRDHSCKGGAFETPILNACFNFQELGIHHDQQAGCLSQIPWESCEVSGPPKGLLRGPNTYSEGIWLKIGSSCSLLWRNWRRRICTHQQKHLRSLGSPEKRRF